MKFALTSRLPAHYLEKADEILVEYRDRRQIADLGEKYPDKKIILVQHMGDELDMKELVTWDVLCHSNLIVCLTELKYVDELNKNEIQWYWGFPIATYYQLNALEDMGACYARLDAPIFFDLPKVKTRCHIPIRAVPNVAYIDGLTRMDGVVGTWIRPEDVDAYDEYIDVLQFEDCDLRKEQAMYRIYAEDKNWPTDLGLLITNLNHIGTNRMIMSEASEHRINCEQECQRSGVCRICYRMLDIANPDLVRRYVNGGE